jgi:AraC-like DNA-binding protein
MKAAPNRTPKDGILRVRFREVERLLRETDLTIDAIAVQTEFTYSHYLPAAFKEAHGQTPGEFREQEIALTGRSMGATGARRNAGPQIAAARRAETGSSMPA